MNRRLTPDELSQVFELYRAGKSTYKLARQFGTDRHTITGHLPATGSYYALGRSSHHSSPSKPRDSMPTATPSP